MNSIFVLTEQLPQLGIIKEKGAAGQIKLFLMARKRWARRQAKGVTLPTLVQLMEESDIELLSTIALGQFQQEDEMTFSAEYRDRAGASNQRDEERFWISDDDDDDNDDDREEDMGETLNLIGIAVPPRRESATRRDSTQFKRVSHLENLYIVVAKNLKQLC